MWRAAVVGAGGDVPSVVTVTATADFSLRLCCDKTDCIAALKCYVESVLISTAPARAAAAAADAAAEREGGADSREGSDAGSGAGEGEEDDE